jgi:hypothetical protein
MPKKSNMSWHGQYVNKSVRDTPADIYCSVLLPPSRDMSGYVVVRKASTFVGGGIATWAGSPHRPGAHTLSLRGAQLVERLCRTALPRTRATSLRSSRRTRAPAYDLRITRISTFSSKDHPRTHQRTVFQSGWTPRQSSRWIRLSPSALSVVDQIESLQPTCTTDG